MPDPIILFDKVNKWYGDSFHVLRDINLNVAPGERIVILVFVAVALGIVALDVVLAANTV